MILSNTLSRRADSEELKVKLRETTLLPSTLFVNLLDCKIASHIAKTKDSEYDISMLERLNFLTKHPDAIDPDWTISKQKDASILYYKGKQYIPQNAELRKKIMEECHDHALAGHPGAATTYYLVQ